MCPVQCVTYVSGRSNLLRVSFMRLSANQFPRQFVAHVAQLRSLAPPCRTIPDATLRLFVIHRRPDKMEKLVAAIQSALREVK
jgi:hypothetical protein